MMQAALSALFAFAVFPGFLFSATAGLLVGWIDRKVTARVQWRVGPPWYQNFVDVIKLACYKETLTPAGASGVVFFGMPAMGLVAATVASTLILLPNLSAGAGFAGDLIVIIYLLMVPSLALMLGAFASGNPLASLGASREMKLILSYELPFILAILVPVMKSGYALSLGSVIASQAEASHVASLSGILSFAVMLLTVQAKLGFIPFDMPEAETELMSGPYIEYSGKALAVLKITKAIVLFALPVFVIALYCGGVKTATLEWAVRSVLQYLGIVAILVVIKNTNPRVRIDQAVGFFWKTVTLVALAAVVLAYRGF